MGCAHRAHRRRRTLGALHRPPVHPRGDVARGFRRPGTARYRRGTPGTNHRHGRPQHPDRRPAPADRRGRIAAPGRGAGGQLRQIRHRTFRRGKPAPGHRAHHRPRTGIHTAGHDHRLRRQPHLDARGTGRRGIRRRHLGGRDGLRQPVHHPVQAAEHAHHGRRDTAPGRRSQGCRALHHLAAHRFGRHGLLHRIRRRSDPFALDGGAHDRLQHEHRVRCAGAA